MHVRCLTDAFFVPLLPSPHLPPQMKHLLFFPLLLTLAACGDSDAPQTDTTADVVAQQLTVEGAYAATAPAGGTGGVFLTIQGGSADDALLSVSYSGAERVEIHRTSAGADGMMQMEKMDRLDVRAGRQVSLEPGGYHVMLINLTEALTAGETLDLTMTFEEAGAMMVPVDIRALSDLPSMGGNESTASDE